jgi:hypothetical protein
MSLNRLVALLTPFFAAAAGWVATVIADNVPGVTIDRGALEEIFIAGALVALAPAAQWLHGWQKYESRQADRERDVALAEAAAPTVVTAAPAAELVPTEEEAPGLEELGELDELAELEQLAEMDELDAEILAEDEQSATAES